MPTPASWAIALSDALVPSRGEAPRGRLGQSGLVQSASARSVRWVGSGALTGALLGL